MKAPNPEPEASEPFASPASEPRVLRVANCSGFYGDRASAALEMVTGGPIDVLTGDYLAELTMAILQKDRRRDPALGYARTFPRQLRDIAELCLHRGIKIVVNAGGLNPAGCAAACEQIYQQLGLEARVAYLEGDDLLPHLPELQQQGEAFSNWQDGRPLAQLDAPVLSANAYLGAWGIVQALKSGADLVICPRVTDASLVVGPAAWHFAWSGDDWHPLASAVVAGHILECGAQATGGNYAFFHRLDPSQPAGFPIAEIEADGSFTVCKHPATGGEVSVGTVTAQLLYEIAGPDYANPDVTALFDSISLHSTAPDRVRVTGVRGQPPPDSLKVCVNYFGGYRNRVTFLLGEPDLKAKARWAEDSLWRRLGGQESFQETRVTLHRAGNQDDSIAERPEESLSQLTVAVKDQDEKKVGRQFSAAAVEMALASYPGFNLSAPPAAAQPFAVYWPTGVSRSAVAQEVVIDGRRLAVTDPVAEAALRSTGVEPVSPQPMAAERLTLKPTRETRLLPLGRICGARSGDKGGHANLGVWVESEPAYLWLVHFLTIDRLRAWIPDAADLQIDRYPLPNLLALNFVLQGFLGDGVAASLALDAQAKGLGEFLRSRKAPIPSSLLAD